MIAIARDVARKFRAIAKKCLAGRPRAPAPVFVCRVRTGTLSLWTRTESAGLLYSAPCPLKEATVVVPIDVFAAIEGPGTEAVEISVDRKLQGKATWTDQGVPQSHSFVAMLPGKQHVIPECPELTPMPAEFVTALHECGKTVARDAGRFVLNLLQIRGKGGQVIATDSKRALIWGGFVFPFGGDVLIPAIPVFGCRELADEAEISVGHSATDLVVACGPWSVHLPVPSTGKYPDVLSILPKPGTGTSARLDKTAAEELLHNLPALPGAKEEDQPVTLELGEGLVVRSREEATNVIRELSLGAFVAGPGRSMSVNRQAVGRALTLGCRTIRIHPAAQTLSLEGSNRTLIVAALDPTRIVPRPASSPRSDKIDKAADRQSPHSTSERSTPMKTHETNGSSSHGRHDSPAEETLDPLAEAEALRVAIAEVGTRVGRLVAALRSSRKEKKVLAGVWAGLRQLNLGGGAS
jgi:hypothetical protein